MKLIIVLCVLSFSGGPLFSQDWKIYYTDNQNPDQNKYGVIAFDDHFEYHPQGNYVQAYREISFRVSEEETIPDDAILNFNSHFAMSNAFWNHLSYWDWEKEEYVEVDLKEISGDPSRWTMDNYWSYPDEEGVFGLQRYGYVDNYRLVATGLKKTTILRIKIGLIFSKNYSMYDESFGRFNAPIGNWHYQKEGGTSYRLYNPNSRVEYETPEISGSGTDEIGYYIEGNLNTSITAKEKNM